MLVQQYRAVYRTFAREVTRSTVLREKLNLGKIPSTRIFIVVCGCIETGNVGVYETTDVDAQQNTDTSDGYYGLR